MLPPSTACWQCHCGRNSLVRTVPVPCSTAAQECMLPALNGLLAGEEWQHWAEDLDRLW